MANRAYRNGVRMQRRHFELIAEVIAKELDGEVHRLCAQAFAQDLKATNAQFNRERFLRACGVEQ